MRGTIAFLVFTMFVASAIPASCVKDAATGSIRRLDGSTIKTQQLDDTITKLMNVAEVPGLQLAIINDGRIVYVKGYGFRDKAAKQPVTADTVMTGASFSKSAFAYMVMKLVDARIVDLDKPIYQYLPKPLPAYEKYQDLAGDERYRKITARMLLSHTAGFPNWRAFTDDRKLHIYFEPGTRFAYSGEGIDLLQLVVETVTKKPLEELMQQKVFRPLGMTRSSMVWQPQFESDYANGYDEYGRSLGPERRKTADAAGSMQTTITDFAKLVQAALDGQGLSEKARAEMLKAQIQITSQHEFPSLENIGTDANQKIKLSYGLGWGLYWTPDGEAFFKEGHDEGWRNYAVSFDRPKLGIVIMTNSSNGEGLYEYVLEKVQANSFTPIEWEGFTPYDKLPPKQPLKKHETIMLDPKVLNNYVGQYALAGMPGVLKVRRSGDHLSVQENDETPQELMAESPKDFYSTSSDDTCTFEVDTNGKAALMILHLPGRDLRIQRVK